MSVTTVQQGTVETMDALFQQRLGQVPVLRQRAEAEGIKAIRAYEDMVPLLFPHTTYKSYPESLVAKRNWAQMNRWLDSLSTHRVDNVDVAGVEDVDDWIDRLEAAGHLVTSSSGTSGKGSFLNKTRRDREVSLGNLIDCLTATGLPPEPSWHVVPVGPSTSVSHHNAVRDMIIARYARPDSISVPEKVNEVGHHRYMSRLAAMRRAMTDGTAAPDEVAAFEAEAAARQAEVEERLSYIAGQLLEHRTERVMFNATFPMLFRLCEILRGQGVSVGDISGPNAADHWWRVEGYGSPGRLPVPDLPPVEHRPEPIPALLQHAGAQPPQPQMPGGPLPPGGGAGAVRAGPGRRAPGRRFRRPGRRPGRFLRYNRRWPLGRDDLGRQDPGGSRLLPLRQVRADHLRRDHPVHEPARR